MADEGTHELAEQIELRVADLRIAVERWLAGTADRIDASVDHVTAPLEDLIAASARPSEAGRVDELSIRRADRALAMMLEELAAVSVSLRMGPPPTVDYRLRALAQALRSGEGSGHGLCRRQP